MALPKFLYSTSESIHEELLPSEGALSVTPRQKNELTGALSKSKREVANSPALRPSFVGNIASDTEEEAQQATHREWEFGGAAVAMELSEPGARRVGSDQESDSESDESGILETMGEPRREQRRSSPGQGNGTVVTEEGPEYKDFVCINADVQSSSPSARSKSPNRTSARTSSLSGITK